MGTFTKSFGAAGGYIAGDKVKRKFSLVVERDTNMILASD